MSILIKGMEMPKAGELLCIDILPDGKVYIHLDLENKRIATAVSVPPHGDLIDRGVLLDAMFKLVDEETFMAFQQAVNDAPTIIEAEVEE